MVIAFASELPEVINRFKALAAEHTVFAPHLPLYAGSEEVTNAWLEKYAGRLQNVYNKLADEQSRKVFANALNYKLSGRPEYLWQCETDRTKDLMQLFTFGKEERYLDLGAYDGDTVREFCSLPAAAIKK